MTEAILGLAALLALAFVRVPIAISMGLVGFLGLWWMRGIGPSMASASAWATTDCTQSNMAATNKKLRCGIIHLTRC